ncbi:MAG: fused DSP-PTPase phosphatase/NAD kinase-like protein [Candidatus Aminicenantales bacterium]
MSGGFAPQKPLAHRRNLSIPPRLAAGMVLVLLASLLVAGSSGAGQDIRPDNWAQPVPSATLSNWYKLDDDVYRSEQPTRKGFEEIRAHGIVTIINLRSENSDDKLVEGLGFFVMDIPMSAFSVSEDDVVKALGAIQAAPKPVLVHCQYGSDRAGVIMAMYRVVIQNWTKEDALAEMTQGGFQFHFWYFNLPALVRSADVAKIRKRLGLGQTG